MTETNIKYNEIDQSNKMFPINIMSLFITGSEVQSRGAARGGSILLRVSDPHRECALRNVQHAHQHLHKGSEREVR